MMKRILILVMLVAGGMTFAGGVSAQGGKSKVVKISDVEKGWSDAKVAFEEYMFGEAIELIDNYLANPKHNVANDAACAELKIRAEKGEEMMEGIEEVTILDSVKTLKSKMIGYYGIEKETGMLKQFGDGGVMFTTGRGDRSIIAEQSNGQFDLYLTYTDGEKRRLPEMVNGEKNENYPFELTDGATLYFASDGHGSIGGYDIFVTRYNNETMEYSEPMQVGFPFNSIYNDYMMVIDELANVGWFATDRHQTGDTVVIYKFKVSERKEMLARELDDEIRRATAQMRRYRVGYDEKRGKSGVKKQDIEIEQIRFVVSDTLIYTSESQFKDPMSLQKFREIKEIENTIKLRSIVMEGKKREYQTSEEAEDRQMLKNEILEDEQFIEESGRKIAALTKEIRKLEYLQYDK